MESSRAKVAGPLAAAGAVSVGLIIIGACGVGKDHTYVAPPPIKSDGVGAPAARSDSSTATPAVSIPPSPTWRVASEEPQGKDRPRSESATESSTTRTTRSTDETGRTNYPPPSRSIYETSREQTTSPSTGYGYDADRTDSSTSSTTTYPTSTRAELPFQNETSTSARPTYGRTSTGTTEATTTTPTRSTTQPTSSGTYPLETETEPR